MAVCTYCYQDMSRGISCTFEAFHRNGERIGRLRWSLKKRDGGGGPCWDCGVPPDGFHHPGCDTERCPVCYRQAITCGCLFDEDPTDEEDVFFRDTSHAFVPDPDDPNSYDQLLAREAAIEEFEEALVDALMSPRPIPIGAILAPVELRHRGAIDQVAAWLDHSGQAPLPRGAIAAAFEGLAPFTVAHTITAGVGAGPGGGGDGVEAPVFRLLRPDVMTVRNRAEYLMAGDPPPWLGEIASAVAIVLEWSALGRRLEGDPLGALLEPLLCDHGMLTDLHCQCWRPITDDDAEYAIRLPSGAAELGDSPTWPAVARVGAQAFELFGQRLAATTWRVPASLATYRLLGRLPTTSTRPTLFVFGPRGVPGPLRTLAIDHLGTGHVATVDRRYRDGLRWDPSEPGPALVAARVQ